MAAALIKFTQGLSDPPAGEALIGQAGFTVDLSNGSDAGVSSWTWVLLDAPDGSALVSGDAQVISTAPTAQFTPDVVGGYMVRLTVTDAAGVAVTDERVFQVEENLDGDIIPPFAGRVASMNFGGTNRKGWAKFVEIILRKLLDGGGGGGSPGGAVGEMQYHGVGDVFAGTPNLIVAGIEDEADDEIEHRGKPRHYEEWIEFRVDNPSPALTGFRLTQEALTFTNDDTPLVAMTISAVPSTGFFRTVITVTLAVSYVYDDGDEIGSAIKGGEKFIKAVFIRNQGFLFRQGFLDMSASEFMLGAEVTIDIVKLDDDNIDVVVTGLPTFSVYWTLAASIQVAEVFVEP